MSINMEFRNVVFNAARDGKLRRLKVSKGNPQSITKFIILQCKQLSRIYYYSNVQVLI